MRQERDHEHEMYLRALADFDNYRRRMERERTSSARQGKREILLPMIDLLDGFERAADHLAEAPASTAEGFRAIHRQLLSLLDAQGVTPLATAGQNFDPGLHEAVDSEPSEEHESGKVTGEVRRGYRWGEELLRPARVRVAR